MHCGHKRLLHPLDRSTGTSPCAKEHAAERAAFASRARSGRQRGVTQSASTDDVERRKRSTEDRSSARRSRSRLKVMFLRSRSGSTRRCGPSVGEAAPPTDSGFPLSVAPGSLDSGAHTKSFRRWRVSDRGRRQLYLADSNSLWRLGARRYGLKQIGSLPLLLGGMLAHPPFLLAISLIQIDVIATVRKRHRSRLHARQEFPASRLS